MSLSKHSALMQHGKRSEARQILKAAIYVYPLNLERHTEAPSMFFFLLFSPFCLRIVHRPSFCFVLYIICGERRKTGFDNHDWPKQAEISQIIPPVSTCSWWGSWHVATRKTTQKFDGVNAIGARSGTEMTRGDGFTVNQTEKTPSFL